MQCLSSSRPSHPLESTSQNGFTDSAPFMIPTLPYLVLVTWAMLSELLTYHLYSSVNGNAYQDIANPALAHSTQSGHNQHYIPACVVWLVEYVVLVVSSVSLAQLAIGNDRRLAFYTDAHLCTVAPTVGRSKVVVVGIDSGVAVDAGLESMVHISLNF
jgi:hypothetical protein